MLANACKTFFFEFFFLFRSLSAFHSPFWYLYFQEILMIINMALSVHCPSRVIGRLGTTLSDRGKKENESKITFLLWQRWKYRKETRKDEKEAGGRQDREVRRKRCALLSSSSSNVEDLTAGCGCRSAIIKSSRAGSRRSGSE